jgi:hypothetical protein
LNGIFKICNQISKYEPIEIKSVIEIISLKIRLKESLRKERKIGLKRGKFKDQSSRVSV